jgi:hypothetical protein
MFPGAYLGATESGNSMSLVSGVFTVRTERNVAEFPTCVCTAAVSRVPLRQYAMGQMTCQSMKLDIEGVVHTRLPKKADTGGGAAIECSLS